MSWILKKVEKETEPQCWHCSTNIKYVCWIKNTESGETIGVGRNCCNNFLSLTDQRKASLEIDTLTREAKIHKRVAIVSKKHPNATQQEKRNIANWINVIGLHWHKIKEHYPNYYYAIFPKEKPCD